MRRLNPLAIALLLSPLLLNPVPLHAAMDQLEAERERLKSETRMIKEQIQAEQTRIEQLKRRIELFRAQNRAAEQHILKEAQRYNHDEI
ncbi:MAG: hypothetical protein L3J26_10430 [Candidatus Polarisedimenticolaceae bacterium]|nr:hypothetical protein [Candidatus Polarisedimenticolaceae bacterium]